MIHVATTKPTRLTYIGIVRKEPSSDYGVDFPDIPGCISAGNDIAEAIQQGTEAATEHIRWMNEEGDTLPPESAGLQLTMEELHTIACIFIVEVEV